MTFDLGERTLPVNSDVSAAATSDAVLWAMAAKVRSGIHNPVGGLHARARKPGVASADPRGPFGGTATIDVALIREGPVNVPMVIRRSGQTCQW